MAYRRHAGPALLALAGFLLPGTTWARQNIAIGEITIGYDYQERNYAQAELADPLTSETADTAAATDVENGATTEGGTVADTAASTTESTASTESTTPTRPTPTLTDPREGDTRSLFVTPRIRVSSTGATDLVEFTYGPTFTWDEVDNSDNVGHDLSLNAEKNLSPRWLVRATDSFYYGEDTVADYQRRSGDIVPTSEAPAPEAEVAPEEPVGQELTEAYGRREYWRNDFGLQTDYTYAPDSVVGAGYNFGLLRNVNDDVGGYDDYDRHEGIGRLSYRFSNRWRAETQLSYVKGIYDEAQIPVRQPAAEPVTTDNTGDTTTTGNGNATDQTTPTPEETTTATEDQPAETTDTIALEELNDDLEEYHGRFRLNYDWRASDLFFGEYSYSATNYESQLNEDAAIHRFTGGWEHDFTSRLRMTLSAGPTFITYDESDNDTGYNAAAGLVWNLNQSSFTATTAYDYEFENFDGRRSGLSKIWRSQLGYSYNFTPNLQTRLTTGYERADREEPRDVQVISAIETATAEPAATDSVDIAPAEEPDHFQYTEETWDAGLSVSYTFLRRYTVSVSYRYADFQSEYDLDYDEHRVLLSLTATSDIFRW